jgi:uncharacterized protein YigA (DUF484 family)
MKEKLEAKLKELQAGLAQSIANQNAFTGAIQIVQQLIKEEEAAEVPTQQEKVTKSQLPKASNSPKVLTLPAQPAN